MNINWPKLDWAKIGTALVLASIMGGIAWVTLNTVDEIKAIGKQQIQQKQDLSDTIFAIKLYHVEVTAVDLLPASNPDLSLYSIAVAVSDEENDTEDCFDLPDKNETLPFGFEVCSANMIDTLWISKDPPVDVMSAGNFGQAIADCCWSASVLDKAAVRAMNEIKGGRPDLAFNTLNQAVRLARR